jgi:ABC-type multidrug transport system fused ATPase/permease subunit
MAAPVSEFLGVSVVVILMWYGAQMVFDLKLPPETFFAFVFAFYQVIEPAKSFAAAYFNIQKGLAAMDRIDRVLDTPNTIKNPIQPIKNIRFEKVLTFQNITFAYDNVATPALDNIYLDIPKGKVVALVGSSGSGKSTMADMMPRFYDPQQGALTIDGVDIREMELASLRSLYGIVNQEPILFNDTIAGNISFGNNGISMDHIIAAAKVANAHDFISALPDGYQTNIGDRGVKLSGGQRQRLTIARAIIRNPPILILDEATSALDVDSERLVQDAINKVMVGRTSIVIAHRLSTIQDADIIVVMEHGRIVQQGDHHSLMNIEGPYKGFIEKQSLT